MAKDRYLLAYTQPLKKVPFSTGFGGAPPYTLEIQRERLLPQLTALASAAQDVPAAATASGLVVAVVRMNPQALSRSAFPDALLKSADWRLLGSRSALVRPEGGRAAGKDKDALTKDLFIAATPLRFKEALPLLMATARQAEKDPIAEDFRNLESIRIMNAGDRIKPGIEESPEDLELVLHYEPSLDADWRDRFSRFAKSSGVHLDPGMELQSGGLLFMTATATRSAAAKLSEFTFLRAVRPLPEPRPLQQPKLLRSAANKSVLPTDSAVDPGLSIAIFDGGLPPNHPFQPWANAIEPPPYHDIGPPIPRNLAHGLAVTSAALFGSIQPNILAPRPFAAVDHYRVLGTKTNSAKGLFKALQIIDEILTQRSYPLISISFGPPEPFDDDHVSVWTTLLDDHLADGTALACIAAGNNGEDPPPADRLLAPSDSVNALGVGACDSMGALWDRASYSPTGPGRSPGLIKPDVLHFGGVDGDPYLFAGPSGLVYEEAGTSFATPGLVRMAAGMRAHFGDRLSPMALKALLVHCAERETIHSMLNVGWGRARHELAELTVCPPGCARVIYSGKLSAGGVVRAPILLPPGLNGDIEITATLCYTCHTDANTPGDYTRAGLDITFRPDTTKVELNKKGKPKANPPSASFFKQHDHLTEEEHRTLAQKWNTVMHDSHGKRVSKLKAPGFDLHYVAREPGSSGSPSNAPEINYALVISLSQNKTADLYEKVQSVFAKQISVIEPVVAIDITLSA